MINTIHNRFNHGEYEYEKNLKYIYKSCHICVYLNDKNEQCANDDFTIFQIISVANTMGSPILIECELKLFMIFSLFPF